MKKGFTLAEVLITLAIIGIVAVLTLPNILGNYQNRVLMTQLQKTYNTINNAVSKALSESDVETWNSFMPSGSGANAKAKAQRDFLKNYFATVDVCDYSTGYNQCLAESYTNLAKGASMTLTEILDSTLMNTNGRACATTTSGATICVSKRGFLFDTNGVQGPNISGKDLFFVGVYQDGKIRLSQRDKEGGTYDGNNYQTEARGDKCLDTSNAIVDPSNTGCLSYIISHGWKFKY